MVECNKLGPFSQTLFLGCSVRNFEANFSWGADTGSCSVGLVHDVAAPMYSDSYNKFKTRIRSITNKTGDEDTTSTAFNAKDLNPSNDPSKSLTRNLADNINEKNYDSQNIGNQAAKVTYNTSTGKEKIWRYGDPGFIPSFGDTDIIGCPVQFQFHNQIFTGLVKNWTINLQGLIQVEIASFADLLKNTSMILQKYTGSISSLIPGTKTFGVNYLIPWLPSAGGVEYNVAIPSLETHQKINGTIFQGNCGNIINVFGHLGESNTNWSKGRGILAGAVYDALVYLLGANTAEKCEDGEVCYYTPYQTPNSPFGGLLAKAPFNRQNGTILQIGGAGGAGFQRNTGGWCFSSSGTGCPGFVSYLELGMLPTVTGVDGLPRSLIRLNLENVPKPPDGIYINNDTMTVLEFIDFCFNNSGIDYFITFTPYAVGNGYTGEIGFTSVSRRKSQSLTTIKNLIDNIKNDIETRDKIIDYKYGQEYSDSVTKNILIGGPQKRMHQMTSVNYGVMRHRRIFEPSKASTRTILQFGAGSFTWRMPYGWARNNVSVGNNRYVEPNTESTRKFTSQDNPWRSIGNSVIAQSYKDFYTSNSAIIWNGGHGSYASTNRANNLAPKNASLPPPPDPNLPPPPPYVWSMNDDMIAPYFGLDSRGNTRVAEWFQDSNQFWVQIPGYDIDGIFYSAIDDGNYFVSEVELRYALGGFDGWWLYTTYKHIFGVASPMGALMYNQIQSEYGTYVADHIFYGAVSANQKIYQAFHEKYSGIWGNSPMSNAEFIDVGINYFHNTGLKERAKTLHNFISTLAAVHYGKTFMVRLPSAYYYNDSSGKAIWSTSITDGAWENDGAPLDDLMVVGDSNANTFKLDDGRIGPFVGYNTSKEIARPNHVTNGFGNILGSYWPVKVNGTNTVTVGYDIPNHIGYRPGDLLYAHGGAIPVSDCQKTYVGCTFPRVNPFADDDQNPSVVWYKDTPRAVIQVGGAEIVSDGGLSPMNYEIMALTKSALSNFDKLVILNGLNDPVGTACLPRMAMPVFAAIPMTHNFQPYGPWASHPGMIAGNIFKKHAQANVNNLAGGSSVEIDETMVPWEYGGIEELDDVGMRRVGDKDKYEQVIEYGSITLADFDLGATSKASFNEEGRLVLYKDTLQEEIGPVNNRVNCSVSSEGVKTTYDFRTFTRKLGLYNKEITDNMRAQHAIRTELNRKIRAAQGGY